jgi:ankyrin repeat protein
LLAGRPELARNELSSWAEGVLMMPAKKRDRALIDLLLVHGAQVPALSKWGRFYYFKHDDVAALLLARGMSAQHCTWHEVTLLHDVAQSGDVAKARLLLDHGAALDSVEDEYRSTPLGLAARWGRKATVELLLARGANPSLGGAAWSTPLAWARNKGHAEIERMLLAALDSRR